MENNKELWMYDCEFIWWDDYDIPYIKNNMKCIVAGYSFSDVVNRLEQWYGKDGIDELSIKIIDDTEGGVYEVEQVPSVK